VRAFCFFLMAATDNATPSSTAKDALGYIEKIRTEFKDEPRIYDDFLETMMEFKSGALIINDVILKILQLFQGHIDLILDFNMFLPPGYEITASADNSIKLKTPERDA
jgi:paired amphipathic helix protein Sin3a